MRRMITGKQVEALENLDKVIKVDDDVVSIQPENQTVAEFYPNYIKIGNSLTLLNNYTINGKIFFDEGDLEMNIPFTCSGILCKNYNELLDPNLQVYLPLTSAQVEQLNTRKPSTAYFEFLDSEVLGEFTIITNRIIKVTNNTYVYDSNEEKYVLSGDWKPIPGGSGAIKLYTTDTSGLDLVKLLNL